VNESTTVRSKAMSHSTARRAHRIRPGDKI
jgi:hypothetical protein